LTQDLRILKRRDAYLPVNNSHGIFRIAEVEWGVGSINYHAGQPLTTIRLLQEGCLIVESEGEQKVTSGQFLVHLPHQEYHQRVAADAPCRLLMLSLAGSAFALRWRREISGSIFPSVHCEEAAHLLLGMLCRAEQADPEAPQACARLLESFFDHCRRSVLKHDQHQAQDLQRVRYQALENLLEQVTDEPRRPESLADLAAGAGIDRSTLHRYCHSVHGCSPGAYRQRLRLARAAHLLHETSQSIQAIAEQVGFSCPFAFSKAFKRQYGLPPSQCR